MFDIIDYEDLAVQALSNQYRKPHMEMQATIIGMVFNELQEAMYRITFYCFLDNSSGKQLDFLGAIWGVSRGSYNDKDYRAEIKQNTSLLIDGTPKRITNTVLANYDATYAYLHNINNDSGKPSATYTLVTDGNIGKDMLERISPSGVEVGLGGFIKTIKNDNYLRKIKEDINIISIG